MKNPDYKAPAKDASSNPALKAIKDYLDKRAATDSQFAARYAKPKKSLDECFKYILGEAKKRGTAVCMTDEEVLGLAVHYYDEDNIKISQAPAAKVSTSQSAPAPASVKLTKEEKEAARLSAIQAYERQCLEEEARRDQQRRKKAAEKKAARKSQQPQPMSSLFEFE